VTGVSPSASGRVGPGLSLYVVVMRVYGVVVSLRLSGRRVDARWQDGPLGEPWTGRAIPGLS